MKMYMCIAAMKKKEKKKRREGQTPRREEKKPRACPSNTQAPLSCSVPRPRKRSGLPKEPATALHQQVLVHWCIELA
jgi:hypothetical protein